MNNNTNLIIVFSVICLLFSCASNNKIDNELHLLTSKPIKLSNKYYQIYKGKNAEIVDYSVNNYKMIIYSDSNSCTSCAITKLLMWQDIIDYSSNFKKQLNFYFIFNPPKGESIRPALRNSLLDYPVLLDSLGEFERLNPHLPKNKAMHTFLLDEDNNVILVGNPLQNKEIEKMFYEEVEKRLR